LKDDRAQVAIRWDEKRKGGCGEARGVEELTGGRGKARELKSVGWCGEARRLKSVG
jgi:hypothetical protein